MAFHLTAWVTLSSSGRIEWRVCVCRYPPFMAALCDLPTETVGQMEQLRLGKKDQIYILTWERVKEQEYRKEM